MDNKFIKKIFINNFIPILFESFFIFLILNNFFGSIFNDFWINWEMIKVIVLVNLSIIFICAIIFSFRYSFELKFKKIVKYYLGSFLLLSLIYGFLIAHPMYYPIRFFLLLISLNLVFFIISFIDFKIRKFIKK